MPRREAWTQRTPWACSNIWSVCASASRDRRRPVAEAIGEPELDLDRLALLTGSFGVHASARSSAAASSPKRHTSRPTSLRSRHARANP